MTNNETATATNVYITEFYNQRGDSERNFDILNNDFNCNLLPFSFLNANVVYLFAAAISFTLFEWIKRVFFDKGVIKNTVMRCKKFLFDFMILPAKWIKTARQWVYKIFTTRACYKPLMEKDLFPARNPTLVYNIRSQPKAGRSHAGKGKILSK